MENKPLKRLPGLRHYSIDHHQGLLLCWKIRAGIKNNVTPDRISAYVEWFYKNELIPHFRLEEKYLFPVLGKGNQLVQRALTDHAILHTLISKSPMGEESLLKLAGILEKHIRFEERVLFKEVQKLATPENLAELEKVHGSKNFVENSLDEFWKISTRPHLSK